MLPSGLGLAADIPARLELTHPVTGEPLRDNATGAVAWIDLYSADSQVVRAIDRLIGNRRIQHARRNRAGQVQITTEQIESEQAERLAAATKNWSLVTLDGQAIADFPCGTDNARQLYEASEMRWLTEQVAAFMETRGNFSPASSKS